MKVNWLKYTILFGLILSLLENSNVPVISMFNNITAIAILNDDEGTEAPVNEIEILKIELAKDYLHEIFNFNLDETVTVVRVMHPALNKTNFPYTFYPDVPTPPPNC